MRICGLDEVGRGALAGPLVGAATIINNQCSIIKLKDSKKLNLKQRQEIFNQLLGVGVEYRIEQISVRQINSRGMGWANKEIFRRLIRRIEADKYIIDGNLQFTMKNVQIRHIIKADQTRRCVMAASIIAKAKRDEHMRMLHEKHMVYGWDQNAGYGTKKHIEAIKQYGATKHHREKFVRTALGHAI